MYKWFFSLQFRLIAGFAAVLALTLGSVSAYVSAAAQRELDRLQQDQQDSRAARVERMILQNYATGSGWTNIEPAVEQAGALYGWRIMVRDADGNLVADSGNAVSYSILEADVMTGIEWHGWESRAAVEPAVAPRLSQTRQQQGEQLREITFNISALGAEDTSIGSVAVTPEQVPGMPPEPSLSRMMDAVNRSLLWTGLAAGAGGMLLVSVMSRRVLLPVRTLNSTAQRLGRGDLSQRVATSEKAYDEISQLGRTFNSMAEGLQQSEFQRRRLMADIAHELRTPLSNIRGYVEAVRDGVLQPDAATMNTIHVQVKHLGRLVEDLRLLALTEAGGLGLELEPDSLPDVLRQVVEAFRRCAEEKGITLTLNVPADLPPVPMDRTRIAQVAGNLVENAIAHTPADGLVRVSLHADRTRAIAHVYDTGGGIPEADLPMVFERLYRVDPSRARSTGGAGLGLTIARGLIEAHGGVIYAESSPGEGSRFSFELPLYSGP